MINLKINPTHLLLILSLFFSGILFLKIQKLELKLTQAEGQVNKPSGQQQAPDPEPSKNLEAMPPVTDKDHILGNKNADAVLVVYTDLECPFCKRFHATMQQIVKEYGDKVAWVYRQNPLSFHANAQKEAEATECAFEQGGNKAYWKYVDQLMERTTSNGTGFALDKLVPLASELGLNANKFKQCLDGGKYAQHVSDDMAGGAKAGVQGTPGTIIVGKNGKRDFINGAQPFEQIKQQIDSVLK